VVIFLPFPLQASLFFLVTSSFLEGLRGRDFDRGKQAGMRTGTIDFRWSEWTEGKEQRYQEAKRIRVVSGAKQKWKRRLEMRERS